MVECFEIIYHYIVIVLIIKHIQHVQHFQHLLVALVKFCFGITFMRAGGLLLHLSVLQHPASKFTLFVDIEAYCRQV